MIDLFYLLVAALAVAIGVMIARAVRLTRASIDRAGRDIPLSQPGVTRRVIEQMRSTDVRCPRCGQPAFAMLGTRNRYTCEDDACRLEFEGPDHFPTINP